MINLGTKIMLNHFMPGDTVLVMRDGAMVDKFVWTVNTLAEQENEIARLRNELDEALALVARWEAERDEAPYRVFAPPIPCGHDKVNSYTAGHPYQECMNCKATRTANLYEAYIPGGPEWSAWSKK
jgi:hypothetical protein